MTDTPDFAQAKQVVNGMRVGDGGDVLFPGQHSWCTGGDTTGAP